MAGLIRGAGYCTNRDCVDFARCVLIVGPGEKFDCPSCALAGWVERERGHIRGGFRLYSEVRVEYGFDPRRRCYRDIARVKDTSVRSCQNVYTLQSPLIAGELEAHAIAEAILKNLNRQAGTRCSRSRRRRLISIRPDVLAGTAHVMSSAAAMEVC